MRLAFCRGQRRRIFPGWLRRCRSGGSWPPVGLSMRHAAEVVCGSLSATWAAGRAVPGLALWGREAGAKQRAPAAPRALLSRGPAPFCHPAPQSVSRWAALLESGPVLGPLLVSQGHGQPLQPFLTPTQANSRVLGHHVLLCPPLLRFLWGPLASGSWT